MADRLEIFEQKGGRMAGWRFRLVKDDEVILTSNSAYEDAGEATRVAKLFNAQCYRSHYKIRKARA